MNRFLLFPIIIISLFSCSKKKEKDNFLLLSEAKSVRSAGPIIKEISKLKIPLEKQKFGCSTLCNFLQKHPAWVPIDVIKKLITLHDVDSAKVEKSFINFLNRYPIAGYYPPRDDRAVISMIDPLIKWSKNNKELAKTVVLSIENLLSRISIEDPNSNVRLKIAQSLPQFGKIPQIKKILFSLFNKKRGQKYFVNSAAVNSLGKIGISSSKVVVPLIKALFVVNEGVSAAQNSAFALSLTSGSARVKSQSILFKLVLHTGSIRNGEIGCFSVFGDDEKGICKLFKDAKVKGWFKNDPILFENSSIRILGYMDSWAKVEELSKNWSKASLKKRWNSLLGRFDKELGQKQKQELSIMELALQRGSIPGFERDLSIKRELYISLGERGGFSEKLLDEVGFGELSNLVMATVEAASILPPTSKSKKLFMKQIKSGTCRATSSIWYSILRTRALNKALEDSKVMRPLSKAWNKEITTKGQWSVTRKYWQPFLKQELGGLKKCEKNGAPACLTPHELLRLEILKVAWEHADGAFSKELMNLKPEDLMVTPMELENLKSNELFVKRPWDNKLEEQRKVQAHLYLKKEMNKLSPIGKLLTLCKNKTSCYSEFLLKGKKGKIKINKDLRQKAGRMLLLYSKTDFDTVVSSYDKMAPKERGTFLDLISKSNLKSDSVVFTKLKKINKSFHAKGIDFANYLKFRILYQRKINLHKSGVNKKEI
jgi:hypothetical protein